MADLRSIVYSRDASPNNGDSGQRPLARAFAFETDQPLEAVTAADFLRARELTNAAVGETVILYGPGYMRTFKVASKNGEYVHLQRIGDENGPDNVIAGSAVIVAGEVGIDIPIELGGSWSDATRAAVTLMGCDVIYEVNVGSDKISVDMECACLEDVKVLWQVFP